MTSPNHADTDDDKLAAALRSAIDAEAPTDPAEDDAIVARAIARATATLASDRASEPGDAPSSSPSPIPIRSFDRSSLTPKRRSSSSRALKVALPLAAAFAASLALAGAYVARRSQPPPHLEPTANPRIEPHPTAAPSSRPPAAASEVGVSVNDLPSAAATASPPPPTASTSTSTAEDLFRDANAERRNGNVEKAIDLYRALQKQHPSSSEAQASHVSLGRLLLDKKGDPSGALHEFDAYLKGSVADGGTLAEEARVGRATALQQLGRTDEERRAWEDLIQRHPSSLHVTHARDRLNQLSSK